MGRAPLFTATAVLTIALGVGATSSILAIVNAVLIEALPYREPDRLVFLRGSMDRDGQSIPEHPLGYQDIESLRQSLSPSTGQAAAFESLVPVTGTRSFNLATPSHVEQVSGEMVGAEYFSVLGVRPVAGRTFTETEAVPPNAARVAVISHDLWETRFGSDSAVVGSTITMNEQPYEVIGIAARHFRGLTDDAQVWLPIGLASGMYGRHYTEMRQFRWLSALGRLREDATVDQARENLAVMASRLTSAFPQDNRGFTFTVTPLHDAFFGNLTRPLVSLLAGAAFVLLIACTNVTNLLLARAVGRHRDMVVRVALGAGPRRLVAQVMTESAVLVIAGAIAGLCIARWTASFLVTAGAVSLASYQNVRLDGTVLGLTIGLAAVCALVLGSIPALAAARVAPASGLQERSRGSAGGRQRGLFQRVLVGAQVTLAVVLLIGSGLMAKGLRGFLQTDLGFKPDSLLTLRIDLNAERYRDNARVAAFTDRLLQGARNVPGVQSAAAEGPGYPTSGWYQIHVRREGSAGTPTDDIAARRHHVSPDYFETTGIRIIEGRGISDVDRATSPRVVVVSETFAKRTWPEGRATGRVLLTIGDNPQPLQVVGVAADVGHSGLQASDMQPMDLYASVLQWPARSPSMMTLLVRSALPTAVVRPALEDVLRGVDANLPFFNVQTMRARLDGQTTYPRFLVMLMNSFAALALLLAAIGVYGVISHHVGLQTREIGVRAALGADRSRITTHVLRHALVPVASGAAIGVAAAWGLSRVVASLLYDVSPFDVPTLLLAIGLVLVAGSVAAALPAWRASRVNPVVALTAD